MAETMAKRLKIKEIYKLPKSPKVVDLSGVHLVSWQFPNQVALSSRGLGQVVLSHLH